MICINNIRRVNYIGTVVGDKPARPLPERFLCLSLAARRIVFYTIYYNTISSIYMRPVVGYYYCSRTCDMRAWADFCSPGRVSAAAVLCLPVACRPCVRRLWREVHG